MGGGRSRRVEGGCEDAERDVHIRLYVFGFGAWERSL